MILADDAPCRAAIGDERRVDAASTMRYWGGGGADLPRRDLIRYSLRLRHLRLLTRMIDSIHAAYRLRMARVTSRHFHARESSASPATESGHATMRLRLALRGGFNAVLRIPLCYAIS